MSQLSLPFDPEDCHSHDPQSSMIAAQSMKESGKKALHTAIVLRIVKRHPGKTAVELWELATDEEASELREMQEVRRRLVNLEQEGAVRKGPQRPCSIRTTTQVTWLLREATALP